MPIKNNLKKIIFISSIFAIIITICFISKNNIQDFISQKNSENLVQEVTIYNQLANSSKIILDTQKIIKLDMNNNENCDENILNPAINGEIQDESNDQEEDINLHLEETIKSIISNEQQNTNNKINWDKLCSINKNIIGWIEIPGTIINYPILYSDGLYYINHDFENNINRNGSIFVLNQNFMDTDEICIYGHNMKNGTMFANLANYLNQEFFLNHNKIYIYTKQKTYEGQIFSAYSKGVKEEEKQIKSLDFSEKIEYYKSQSTYKQNTEINNKKIVKLITCSYINAKVSPTDQRYYILAFITERNGI